MPTYYVSSEEHSAIELLKDIRYPLAEMIIHGKKYRNITHFGANQENDLLKYIAGDTDIEFKVKEDQYYLWMYKNNDRDIVYMKFYENVPGYCYNIKDAAFGPFRQLEKFKALGWNLEKVK